ncbi:hypothetical protein ACFL27_15835 [candidate division CSSED10-310 bacterium]|uniref:Lipoprotein n=1 Tax=candidate division CSSED10-310 bacterium TaxID=2855610 RepID=A0ABV6YZN1_UNCC1
MIFYRKRKSILYVLFLVLLCSLNSCVGSLYKKGAREFNTSTQIVLAGYQEIIDEYEKQGVIKEARSIHGAGINTEQDLSRALLLDAHNEIIARRLLIKSLFVYSQALEALATLGTAQEISDRFATLGDQLDRLKIEKAKSWSKIAANLSQAFIEVKTGRTIRKIVIEADPAIQQIAKILQEELQQMNPSLAMQYSAEWNKLRAELNEKSMQEGFGGSAESVALILEMKKQLDKKEKIPELTRKTTAALQRMAHAHSKLTTSARGKYKKAFRDELESYVKSAHDVEDVLSEL